MNVFEKIMEAICYGVRLLRAHVEVAVLGPMTSEEVTNFLKLAAKAHPECTDVGNSIVDLMKVLNLDSSLAAREELAAYLGYEGKLDGSAEMNVWLHKKMMDRIAHRITEGWLIEHV